MSQLQDRIASMVHAFGDQGRQDAVRALARDVGDLEARIAALEAENKALRDRFAEADTERNGAQVALKAACVALDRIAALDAEAKQARDDEAWAKWHCVKILFLMTGWSASHASMGTTYNGNGNTIAAALRALREKVEGGTR